MSLLYNKDSLIMDKNNITKQLDIFCKVISHILSVRSPHTGCHINRVPILADMIARAVSKEQSNKEQKFSDDDYYKIDVAAKLHDCGKTTTPDYLLEKSTKLELVRNRIHEIRNRFEILRRDAEIACLKQIIADPQSKPQAQTELAQKIKQLEQDFAFIAACNIGDSEVSADDVKKLKRIGRQKFKRYFNRLLGLSWFEKQQLNPEQSQKYSHTGFETVLQDNPEDVYKDIPTGEIYNLSTNKGTINPLERKKIEQHAAETAKILDYLQLPPDYACIKNYAAEHHERPNGSGYPLGLTDKDLSVAGKIIMLADIFEALTSVDRPYKAPKKLSETLRILQAMKNKQQLDAEIYHIFITKRIFMQYAEQYLKPEQIDQININDYL